MDFFLARQPIFNTRREVYAYELLFRSDSANGFHCTNGDIATSRVLTDSAMAMDLAEVTAGRPAFVNFTHSLLLSEATTLLPPERVVIEVLETVEPDSGIVEACQRLHEGGYTIALDDFVFHPRFQALVDLADIIKVDFRACDPAEQAALLHEHGRPGLRLLAEKVETHDEFKLGRDLGYELFQGYFFARPEVLSGRTVRAHQLHALELMAQVNAPDPNPSAVERLLKNDPALSYQLLRYINAPYFGWTTPVRGVRHAMVLLGSLDFRKWATVVALSSLNADKPMELVRLAVTRAWFLARLAPVIQLEALAEDLFLLGLFSLLDAMMDQPFASVLRDLPVSEDVRRALVQGVGPYSDALALCVGIERAAWPTVQALSQALGLEEEASGIYLDAVKEADALFLNVPEPRASAKPSPRMKTITRSPRRRAS